MDGREEDPGAHGGDADDTFGVSYRAAPLPRDLYENALPPNSEAPPPSTSFRQERDPENRPSVSLGPLSLLGFGPKVITASQGAQAIPQLSPLAATAALVIIIAGLKVARPVLVPFMVSVFLATLATPAVFYLTRRRVPVGLAVTLVMLAGVLLVGGLFALVAGTINALVQAAPAYQQRLLLLVMAAAEQLEVLGVDASPDRLYSLVERGVVMSFLGDTLFGLADLLSNGVLVSLMTVFVLFEATVLPTKIRAALNDPQADLSAGLRVVARIQTYVVVKTMISLATGLLIGLALQIVGVDFALLWGILAFFLNFIPNIGAIVAAIPPIFLALLQHGAGGAMGTATVYALVGVIVGNILEPRLMGKSMNLSPLVVFACLVFWGWLWGGVGMLLSVPLTMAIRIMLDGNEFGRPFAILMADSGADPSDLRK